MPDRIVASEGLPKVTHLRPAPPEPASSATSSSPVSSRQMSAGSALMAKGAIAVRSMDHEPSPSQREILASIGYLCHFYGIDEDFNQSRETLRRYGLLLLPDPTNPTGWGIFPADTR